MTVANHSPANHSPPAIRLPTIRLPTIRLPTIRLPVIRLQPFACQPFACQHSPATFACQHSPANHSPATIRLPTIRLQPGIPAWGAFARFFLSLNHAPSVAQHTQESDAPTAIRAEERAPALPSGGRPAGEPAAAAVSGSAGHLTGPAPPTRHPWKSARKPSAANERPSGGPGRSERTYFLI